MKVKILVLVFAIIFCFSCSSQSDDYDVNLSKVITQRITNNEGFNNAFTDLIFFDNQWFLSYRESDKHALGRDGVVKILRSVDGSNWNLVKQFEVVNLDLRDVMFTINGDKLMAYVHGSKYEGMNLVLFKDFKCDYIKGKGWQDLQAVLLDKRKGYADRIQGNQAWPWKVTWYKEKAYTFGYGKDSFFDFYTSSNGLVFQNTFFAQDISGIPTEATLEVDVKGVFYVVSRRDQANAILGKSTDFGKTWDWFGEIPVYNFGGPDFVFYADGLLVSGRESNKVVIGYYDLITNKYKKLLTLKSGGDCSYAGMVIKENVLYMSYYSGHENKIGTSIYLSKINLKEISF